MADGLRSAIVIVTYNSALDIGPCVESLSRHLPWLAKGESEVHVVDNGSSDQTVEILAGLAREYDWLRLHLQDRNLGFGPGNNVVLRSIDAEAYVLLNADARLLGDSMTPALRLINRNSAIGVIGLPLVYPDGSPQSYAFMPSAWHRWLMLVLGLRGIAASLLPFGPARRLMQASPFSANFVANHAKPPLPINNREALEKAATLQMREVAWVAGAAMALSGDFVARSRGFDQEIFLYGEDEDLCIQARNLGFKIITLSTLPIVHKLGWGGSGSFRPAVAHLKYDSLKYFIGKNVSGFHNRLLMRAILPFYVYGRNLKYFFRKSRNHG